MHIDQRYEDFLVSIKKQFIDLNPDEKSAYDKHCNALSEIFFSYLKFYDPIFKAIFGGCALQGSSGDDLKVGKPDEYDIVFYIDLPHSKDIKVLRDSEMPGNVHIDMTNVLEHCRGSNISENIFQWLKSLVNDKSLLVVQKLQNYLKSIVDHVLHMMHYRFEIDGKVCQLNRENHGPAHTIKVDGAYKYSIDFVPAIRLMAEKNILGVNESILFKNQTHFEAIPKPMKPFRANSTSFRCSYYDAERLILQNKSICKTVIKFIKKFRDVKTNMLNFKSYYVKILVLRKIVYSTDNNWHSQPLTVILTDVFNEMEQCLRSGVLPFLWHPDHNMLNIWSRQEIQEMHKVVQVRAKLLRDILTSKASVQSRHYLVSTFSTKLERVPGKQMERVSKKLGRVHHRDLLLKRTKKICYNRVSALQMAIKNDGLPKVLLNFVTLNTSHKPSGSKILTKCLSIT